MGKASQDQFPSGMQPARRTRLYRSGLPVALFAVLAFLLAACGSNSPSSNNSGGSGSSQTGNSASSSGPVAFAQCMRTHGVSSFPDPQGGHFLINGSIQNNPNFQTAVQACQHLLGPSGATNGGSNGGSSGGSNNAQLLQFAHCMQTHGVPQFPDPTAGGGIGLPQGVDPNSPTFQNAWKSCQSKLPGSLQGQGQP